MLENSCISKYGSICMIGIKPTYNSDGEKTKKILLASPCAKQHLFGCMLFFCVTILWCQQRQSTLSGFRTSKESNLLKVMPMETFIGCVHCTAICWCIACQIYTLGLTPVAAANQNPNDFNKTILHVTQGFFVSKVQLKFSSIKETVVVQRLR